MRAASGALIALLNSGTQFNVADLLTITQANGTVTRLTSADVDVTAVSQVDGASHVFSAGGVQFARTRTKLVVGLEIDTLTVTLMADPLLHLLGGVPWPAAATAGAFDEARITIERAYMAAWGDTSAGTVVLFSGRVADVSSTRTDVVVKVNSELELLTTPFPRNSYQAGCTHALFDAGCGLSRASFAVSGTALAGGTTLLLPSALAQAADYFTLGSVVFTGGAMAGQSYTVRSFLSGAFVPLRAFAQPPTAGDTFTAYPGCQKDQTTCSIKFANLARFRGFPFVPHAENAR